MKKQKQVTINQHYVPQFYLNNFSHNNKKGKKSIDVFDIDLNKILRNQRIENVAFEKYFYDIDLEKYLNNISGLRLLLIKVYLKIKFGLRFKISQFKNLNTIENILATVESNTSPIFTKIIEKSETYTKWERENCFLINEDEKLKIATFLAVQFLRTPKIRQSFQEANTVLKAQIIQEFHYRDTGEIIDLNELIEEINSEDIKNQHLNSIFTENTKKIVDIFNKHSWVFYKNNTNVDFITSDSPISTKATKDETLMSYGGINSPGVMIIFPITKKLILVMYENELNMNQENKKLIMCNDSDRIEAHNIVTFLNCHRFLYGNKKEFDKLNEYVSFHSKSTDPKFIFANSTIPKNNER